MSGNEIEIKKHSFQLSKDRLKDLLETTAADIILDGVRTDGGLFGWGNHKVTGSEFNDRLETIQKYFIAVNETNNKTIKEFREIYNTLDVLDKDYMMSVVANVKAIEKTSNDVRKQQETLKVHNEKLQTQQSKLDRHQTEIEKNVDNIKKIVEALKIFKEKLEHYQHLSDIDKIYNDCKIIQTDVRKVSDRIEKLSKKAAEDIVAANSKNQALADRVNKDIPVIQSEQKTFKNTLSDLSEKLGNTIDLLNKQIPVIREASAFTERLKNVSHLSDVDLMWDNVNQIKDNFGAIEENLQNIEYALSEMEKRLDEIDAFVNELNGCVHLKDVDEMWDSLDKCKADLDKVSGDIKAQQSDFDNLAAEQKQSTEDLSEKLNGLSQDGAKIRESIDVNAKDIGALKKGRDKLDGYTHLEDVDGIWESVEKHTSQIAECKKTGGELAEAVQTTNSAVETMAKKVKYAFLIAGGSAGLAVVELVLLLLKVL